MATLLISAAGSAIGGSLGGSVLGISAAAIGQAAGAVAGSAIDQVILGQGSSAVETGKASGLRIQGAAEGVSIPQVWGRMRVPGHLIWATRFLEKVRTTTQGGKATQGQRVREFSYCISFAIALCEGPIDRIGRVWADGQLFDLSTANFRIYNGDEAQLPDPKIEAVEGGGNVPAYRGLAYMVFEDLPVGQFGNRIPQLNVEVFRAAGAPQAAVSGPQQAPALPEIVRAVCMSPGTGEFALDPKASRVVFPAGGGQYANINNASGTPDMQAALDQLQSELPLCNQVNLVVSWFGNDLRCGRCRVEPKIEQAGRSYAPDGWQVAGLSTSTAPVISQSAEGRPNFGGSPSDCSVIRAIQEMASRGLAVTLYPFLLMDIVEGNDLDNPYGGTEQPVFPWRGRITLDRAPGLEGTADQTADAIEEVDAFFGTATAADFTVDSGKVTYTGPDEWTWRRFVLHLAALGAAAGGVEAICIGTELRGLTTIRSSKTDFPAVQQLIALAAEVRALLPNTKITYAADWSEYFGYQPQDASGDVLFHLDPLWANANVDAVGIDDYTPLSDWRYTTEHLDAQAGSIYSLPYLASNVEGGEYYDWYYASDADRTAQIRTPITDGAHNEAWIFRPKDIRNWWSNQHYNRIDGVRQTTPTAWIPQSKPVWLTETGCPAVDLGANKPNVFFDGRSSESALPPGSRGARDDEMQRRFLQAKLGYWQDVGNNPLSSVYAGPMIPTDRVFVWTWDARPWPDFPVRESIWADGPSHRLGHWITGRVTGGSLAEVVAELLLNAGFAEDDFDVSDLYGQVDGYVVDRTASAREALQPLMQAFAFDAFEADGRLVFATRGVASAASAATAAVGALTPERLVPGDGPDRAPVERITASQTEATDAVRVTYLQSENDYRVGAAEARLPGTEVRRVSETSFQLALPASRAQQIADRFLAEALRAQETARFSLPPSQLAFVPGDIVQIDEDGTPAQYRLDRLTEVGARAAEAVRVEAGAYAPVPASDRASEPQLSRPPGPIQALILDLPLADGSALDYQPRLAVTADPWPGEVAVYRSADGEGFDLATTVRKPALIGLSATQLDVGKPDRWHRATWDVILPPGAVSSATRLSVLNGANRLALQLPGGGWEILQFLEAELVAADTYRLSNLLRGQRGSEAFLKSIGPGTRIVVMDDALALLPVVPDELGVQRIWKIGPANRDISHESYVTLTDATNGVGLRPFAPAHLRARPKPDGIELTWIRQTRIGGDSLASVEVPLGEETEAYRVTIRQDGNILRIQDTGSPQFLYTSAMQAADGAAGSLEVGVAQLSAAFGYGPEKVIASNV
ncbi:MAG: glycoside hydrolase/phage tail family protein [Pseudomonadota bacterium]